MPRKSASSSISSGKSRPKMSSKSGKRSEKRHKPVAPTLAPNECFGCCLCTMTTVHVDSVRRHLNTVHKIIDSETYEKFYEVRRMPASIFAPSAVGDVSASQSDTTTERRASKRKAAGKCDVGCQVPCMDCEKLQKRADELQKLMDEIFQSADKVKAALTKAMVIWLMDEDGVLEN